MNNTRVIKARLRGVKETGGAIEAMIERVTGENTVISMLRASKKPKPGSRLIFTGENAVPMKPLWADVKANFLSSHSMRRR